MIVTHYEWVRFMVSFTLILHPVCVCVYACEPTLYEIIIIQGSCVSPTVMKQPIA